METFPTVLIGFSPEAKQEWSRVAPETEPVRVADKTGYGHARRLLCIVQLVAASQEVLTTQGTIYVSVKGKLETRPE